jgi:hypothetical protein
VICVPQSLAWLRRFEARCYSREELGRGFEEVVSRTFIFIVYRIRLFVAIMEHSSVRAPRLRRLFLGCVVQELNAIMRLDDAFEGLGRGGAEKLELRRRDEVQLFEVLPRAVVEPEGGKGRVFGIEQMPVVEARILRLVEEANTWRAGIQSVNGMII